MTKIFIKFCNLSYHCTPNTPKKKWITYVLTFMIYNRCIVKKKPSKTLKNNNFLIILLQILQNHHFLCPKRRFGLQKFPKHTNFLMPDRKFWDKTQGLCFFLHGQPSSRNQSKSCQLQNPCLSSKNRICLLFQK